MADEKHIRVEEDGQLVAQASVSVSPDDSSARASVRMAAGQLPAGSRQKVVDAVHDTVADDHGRHLTTTVPLGDSELVEKMRDRLDDVELRAAGATSIIEGDLRDS